MNNRSKYAPIQYTPYQQFRISNRIQKIVTRTPVVPLHHYFQTWRQSGLDCDRDAFLAETKAYLHRLLRDETLDDGDLDDVVSETLKDVWLGLPSFGGRSSITSWIFAILTHNIQRLKKHKRLMPTVVLDEADIPVFPDLPMSTDGLSDRETRIIRLQSQGYTMAQIGKREHTTEDAVKAVLKRLRTRFKETTRRNWYRGEVAEIICLFHQSGTQRFCHVYSPDIDKTIRQWLASDIVIDEELQDHILTFRIACDHIAKSSFLQTQTLQWFFCDDRIQKVVDGHYDPFPAVPPVLTEAVERWNQLASSLHLPACNPPHKTWFRDPLFSVMAEFLRCTPDSDPDMTTRLDDFGFILDQIRNQYQDKTLRTKTWKYTLPWVFSIHNGLMGYDLLWDNSFSGKKQPMSYSLDVATDEPAIN